MAGGELVETLGPKAAERLATEPPGGDEAGCPEPPHVPRDERLRQPDLSDELGDGRLGGSQTADDPEAVDVGEGLVDEAQLAQLVGLEDGVRDRAADAGGRGAQDLLRVQWRRRINDGLYQ